MSVTLLPIVTVTSLMQYKNASVAILVTLLPIVTLASVVQ
jgi:hypothetical protein